jgi:hypothetical protein
MSKATAVKEAVKETLIGAEEPVQLSTQTQARFNQNAVQDAASGDLFLGEEEFINAVAPLTEDYVSPSSPSKRTPSGQRAVLTCPVQPAAQDQA